MDEPISNPTACALFVLSKATKEHVDVVLCGDGGDELFAGYERYRMSYAASIYQKLPSSVTSILSRISGTFNKLSKRVWIDRYAQFMFQKEGDYKAILSPRILNSTATKDLINQNLVGSSFEEAMMNADRKTWLVDFALMLSDTMSMSHGVEARVPFLDRKVVQYALSIPTEKKLSIFTNKILLKNAFKNDLPRYLFRQPKRGFFTPAAKWLRHPDFIVLARDILSPNYSPNTSEIFNWVEVSKMLDDHISKKKYNLTIIWALITFQVWAKQYNVKI
jgi:asparagine synthase (glutamine-hydrolysing)